MRIESVTAHAFGPLTNETLTLAPGMTVITGVNESAKSSWHAAICAAVVGRRRGKGASTKEERHFADLHKPWDGPDWRVSSAIALDDGRRIELTHDLGGKVDCRAMDLGLSRDVSNEIMFEPYPGTISARREGEPSFEFVNGVSDAIMAALARGVDLVVPRELFDQIWVEFPPELPKYVNIR